MAAVKSGMLTIGQLAGRTGLAVSAIRHYEDVGLVHPGRNAGGHRRYHRSDLRRLSFVLIAQRLGFSLPEIRTALDALPAGRTPTRADWTGIAERFRAELDARIDTMLRLRDRLDGCIGCGCLSLPSCGLWNPGDQAAGAGTGPRYLMGDEPPE